MDPVNLEEGNVYKTFDGWMMGEMIDKTHFDI